MVQANTKPAKNTAPFRRGQITGSNGSASSTTGLTRPAIHSNGAATRTTGQTTTNGRTTAARSNGHATASQPKPATKAKATAKAKSTTKAKASARTKATVKAKATSHAKSTIKAKATSRPKASAKAKATSRPKASVKAKAGTRAKSTIKAKASARPKATVRTKAASPRKVTTKAKAGTRAKTTIKAKAITRPKASLRTKAANRSKTTIKAKTTSRPKATAKAKVTSRPKSTIKAKATARPKATTRRKATIKAKTSARRKATVTAKARTRKVTRKINGHARTNGHVATATRAKTNGHRVNGTPHTQPNTATLPNVNSDRQLWVDLEPTGTLSVNKIDLPFLPLEDYEVSPLPKDSIQDAAGGSIVVGWLGVGQGGNRIAQAFHELGYHKNLAVNTSPHDLADIKMPAEQKLLLNIGYEGTGKDMVRGAEAAAHYRQAILHHAEHVFGHGVDHLMVAVGAGGGTGSGAVAGLLDALRDSAKRIGIQRGKRHIGVVCALPTAGEAASPQVRHNAYQVVSQLTDLARRGDIAPLIIVDNDKISRMYPGLTVKSFWPTINATVAGLFHVFNRLSSMPSPYTSFDPDHYRSILQAGGCTVMGLTKVQKFTQPDALSSALTHNLQKTLLSDGFDLTTAKAAGMIVVGGRRIMANTPGLQDMISRAFDVMTDLTGNAAVYRGIFEDDKETLRAYTIVSGLDAPRNRLDDLRGE